MAWLPLERAGPPELELEALAEGLAVDELLEALPVEELLVDREDGLLGELLLVLGIELAALGLEGDGIDGMLLADVDELDGMDGMLEDDELWLLDWQAIMSPLNPSTTARREPLRVTDLNVSFCICVSLAIGPVRDGFGITVLQVNTTSISCVSSSFHRI